jgi:hypothetical protein
MADDARVHDPVEPDNKKAEHVADEGGRQAAENLQHLDMRFNVRDFQLQDEQR